MVVRKHKICSFSPESSNKNTKFEQTLSRTIWVVVSRIFAISAGENTKTPNSCSAAALSKLSSVESVKSKIPCVHGTTRTTSSRLFWIACAIGKASVDEPTNKFGFMIPRPTKIADPIDLIPPRDHCGFAKDSTFNGLYNRYRCVGRAGRAFGRVSRARRSFADLRPRRRRIAWNRGSERRCSRSARTPPTPSATSPPRGRISPPQQS